MEKINLKEGQQLPHTSVVIWSTTNITTTANDVTASCCFNLISALCSSTGSHFSMLGIGDIVMPGLLLCFVLRYDNYKKQANGEVPGPGNMSGRMQRVSYFHCTLIGYFVGKQPINTCKRSQLLS